MKTKLMRFFSLLVVLVLMLGTTNLAFADVVTPDADIVQVGNQGLKDLGNVAPGAVLIQKVSFTLVCNQTKHVNYNQNITLEPKYTEVPPGGGLSATSPTIGPVPDAWPEDGSACAGSQILNDNGDSTVTITAPMTAGQKTYTLKYDPTFSNAGDGPNDITGSTSLTFTLTVVSNTKPVLSLPADTTVEATSSSGASVTYSISATDAEDDPDPTPTCSPASGSGFPFGPTTVNCSVTDSGGLTDTGSFTVTVRDTKPPAITVPSSMTAEAADANGAVVSFDASATDLVDGSVAVTCSPASGSKFALGTTTVNCSATDAHSNSASQSFIVTVEDTTGPVLALPDEITVEATSGSGAVVAFTATASDVVDGEITPTCTPASGSTFPLDTTTVNCTATDKAGNASSASFKITVQDTTPPAITVPADITAEATGPSGAAVTFTVTATDLVDGAVTPVCVPASGSTFPLGDTTVNCSATDAHGNDSSKSFNVKVQDTTPPDITFVSRAPVANGNGWNNSEVTVTWSCTDIVGVVANSVTETVSTEGEDQSVEGTCVDTSGNKASDTQKGINIDKTAPTVSLSGGPADGASYYFGSVPAAPSCVATDALSGLDGACSVGGYGTTVGTHTVTASATDKAGNTASVSATYSVLAWTLKGFYQPVDMNGVYNVVKNGSTVPLKFEIFAGTTELTDVGAVKSLTYGLTTCSATASTDEIETLATGNTTLRYDLTGGQFIFNWKTPTTAGKCYSVTMLALDGSKITAYFKLK